MTPAATRTRRTTRTTGATAATAIARIRARTRRRAGVLAQVFVATGVHWTLSVLFGVSVSAGYHSRPAVFPQRVFARCAATRALTMSRRRPAMVCVSNWDCNTAWEVIFRTSLALGRVLRRAWPRSWPATPYTTLSPRTAPWAPRTCAPVAVHTPFCRPCQPSILMAASHSIGPTIGQYRLDSPA